MVCQVDFCLQSGAIQAGAPTFSRPFPGFTETAEYGWGQGKDLCRDQIAWALLAQARHLTFRHRKM